MGIPRNNPTSHSASLHRSGILNLIKFDVLGIFRDLTACMLQVQINLFMPDTRGLSQKSVSHIDFVLGKRQSLARPVHTDFLGYNVCIQL